MEYKVGYKLLREIAEIIVGIPKEKNKGEERHKYHCIYPSQLQEFNCMLDAERVVRSKPINEKALIKMDDILIKRLSPSYINVATKAYPNTYMSENIMAVRVQKEFDAKYMASILESLGLPTLQHYAKRGVTIQTISGAELQNLKIPILPVHKQKHLGEIWLLGKEKQRILKEVSDEGARYFKALLDKMIGAMEDL